MASYEYDLRYVLGSLDELEAYLLSDELFWPVSVNPPSGGPEYPRLTVGNILLALQRAKATGTAPHQQAEILALESKIEKIRSHWRVKWEQKAAREYTSRLNQWRNYIEEYRQHPEKQRDYFHYEVRWRVILELLDTEAYTRITKERDLTDAIDRLLRSVWQVGGFLWEADLIDQFQKDRFWYLYGLPRGNIKTVGE